jgi:bacillithiol system protein YtxJ
MVKRAIERDWNLSDSELPVYYLDLLEYRSISDIIAERFSVRHESPQLILIRDGRAVYHASHSEIDVAEMPVQR